MLAVPVAHAQGGPGDAPIDKMTSVLPDSLPGRTQVRAGQSDPIGVTGTYERTGTTGPPRIDVRILHGTLALRQGRSFAQAPNTDSTTLSDGRPVHSGVIEKGANPQGIVLWMADNFVVSVESHGTPDASLSAADARASLSRLQRIFVEHLPASRFAPLTASVAPGTPSVTGFEAPEGFTTATVTWNEQRISVAVPKEWSVYKHPMFSVMDLSRNAEAQHERWSGTTSVRVEMDADEEASTDATSEGERKASPVRLHAPGNASVVIADARMAHPFEDLATVDLREMHDPAAAQQQVNAPTVTERAAETTIGGREALRTTVRGTSADGFAVMHQSVSLRAGETVLGVRITRPSNRETVSDATLQTILQSIAVEDADVARNERRQASRREAPQVRQRTASADVVERYPIRKDGAWGYIDREGTMVIEPQFEDAKPFSDGRAKVIRDGAPVFIDSTGAVVLAPDVEWVRSFSDGRAAASPPGSEKAGYIDATGAFVIEPQFTRAQDFSNGRAAVQQDETYGYINRQGTMVIEPQYDDARRFGDERAPVLTGGFVDGQWGYINREGTMVIEPQYSEALPFSEQRAAVNTGDTFDDAYSYIDPSGQIVIDASYKAARSFSNGLAPVQGGFDDQWGYINREGETVISKEYVFAAPFHGSLARVATDGRIVSVSYSGPVSYSLREPAWSYIDPTGRTVWP
jgi:hypothetical protein